jgi:hypothetical protein
MSGCEERLIDVERRITKIEIELSTLIGKLNQTTSILKVVAGMLSLGLGLDFSYML